MKCIVVHQSTTPFSLPSPPFPLPPLHCTLPLHSPAFSSPLPSPPLPPGLSLPSPLLPSPPLPTPPHPSPYSVGSTLYVVTFMVNSMISSTSSNSTECPHWTTLMYPPTSLFYFTSQLLGLYEVQTVPFYLCPCCVTYVCTYMCKYVCSSPLPTQSSLHRSHL